MVTTVITPPPRAGAASIEAVFVPADRSKPAQLALWTLGDADDRGERSPIVDRLLAAGPGRRGVLELVLPAGRSVRRRAVEADLIDWSAALDTLVTAPITDDLSASLAAWALVARFGTELVARGRVVPALSPDDVAGWRIAELNPGDERRCQALAEAMPPLGHALLAPADPAPGGTGGDGAGRSGPIQVVAAERLIGRALDACADALVRSAAAETVVASTAAPFAGRTRVRVPDLRDWAIELDHDLGRGSGAYPGIRVESPVDPDPEEPDLEPMLRAVLQLRSKSDPSLVVDVADLWDAPGPVLARLGDDVETDLLLSLRRGAAVWGPLERALREKRPDTLFINDDQAADLLGSAGAALVDTGFEVLWPTDLFAGPVELRAVVGTPSPSSDGSPALDLAGIVSFDWRASLGGEPLSADELAALAEAKRPLVRLRGRWIVADPKVIEKLRRQGKMRVGDALAASLSGEMVVDGETVEIDIEEGPLADLAGRLAELGGDTPRELAEPAGLEASLRPYQRRGLAWLAAMTDLGIGGCLADDMGLGKTIQLIALHLHRHRHSGPERVGPTLVVCPTSLLGNWEREFHKFAPAVPVRRYHGGQRNLDDLADDEVVLITYGVVRRDTDALAEVGWGLVVADEAQHAKNPLSRTARALRAIPAGARVALTGTPVENRLTELWSILDWTTPGLLGPLDRFQRTVAVPIERHQDRVVTERLAATVRPFLLRRRKTDPGIAPELPPKTEHDVIVPLTPEQVTLYEATVREVLAQIAESEGMSRRGLVLRLLTGLKQITNHPAQFLRQSGPLVGRSGKLAALDELLDVIVDEGESALIFTQYVQMGRLIERHLAARRIPSIFLNGSVSVPQREAMVDRFQAGEVPVMLLSLKAGGTGLNLTAATHVIHYDRWWNPAVEDQATDRAYRIGQDRPVEVHRLVTEGTVEDRIAALLTAKRGLAESVVGGGEAWISELSDDDLADLVTLRATP